MPDGTGTPEERHEKLLKKLGLSPDDWYTKRGRKTLFRKHMIEEAKKLAGLGMTSEEIGVFWKVHRATLERWAKHRPEFYSALKEGKLISDKRVEEALYSRALGYEHTERHYDIEYQVDQAGVVTAVRKLQKEITKQMAADTTAQIYWLKNRRPDKWRDMKELGLLGALGEPLPLTFIELPPRQLPAPQPQPEPTTVEVDKDDGGANN